MTGNPYAKLDPADDQPQREALTAYALRFDGYRYSEDHGFDHRTASETFFADGALPDDTSELMCMLFMLQRFLCKWGGEYEPQHGKYWRLYRTLFLQVADEKVPRKYRQPECYARWVEEYKPNHTQHVAAVRRVHENIVYDDDAEPDLG